MNLKDKHNLFFFASAILFAISLTQKCYCTTNNCGDSFIVLLLGFMGLAYDVAAFTWFANPLLFGSWIYRKSAPRASLLLSFLSTFLAASFLLFGSIVDSESGHSNQIVSYKAGYWLWLSSNAVMLAGNLSGRKPGKQ